MKRLVLGIAAFAFAAGAAVAADLPVKVPPAPIGAPGYNWTGVHVGASIGGLWDHYDGSFVFPALATWSVDHSSGIAGAHAGAQYQFWQFVLGVEGNFISILNTNNGSSDFCHPTSACAVGQNFSGNLHDNIWTAGGRAGWSFGPALAYVSGGFASTKVVNIAALGPPFEAGTTRHNGEYVGGGVDWMVWRSAWGVVVAGVEYRHYAFRVSSAVPTIFATGLPNFGDTWTITPRADTVSGRLSWLFNWDGPPLPKY